MQKIFKQALLQCHSAKHLAPKQLTQAQFLMLNNTSLLAFNNKFFTSRVFVEGLPLDFTDAKLQDKFSSVGNVQRVRLFTNSEGQQTGRALVEFEGDDSAETAISKFNDVDVDSLTLAVRPFVDRMRNNT